MREFYPVSPKFLALSYFVNSFYLYKHKSNHSLKLYLVSKNKINIFSELEVAVV